MGSTLKAMGQPLTQDEKNQILIIILFYKERSLFKGRPKIFYCIVLLSPTNRL